MRPLLCICSPTCARAPPPIPTSCYDLKAKTARKAKKAAKKAKKASATKAADAQKPADANTAEKAEAEEAAALGLLQPLEALSLDADTLIRVTAAAVAYCDDQGADHVADLIKRASMLIANPQAVPSHRLVVGPSGLELWPWRYELLDGLGDALVAARALKPVPAKKFVDAIRASAPEPDKKAAAKKPAVKRTIAKKSAGRKKK
eukprot:scaffold12667_cov50-Phaeocystis_antarctica.AAC.6